ncbi:BCCT family transporter [Halorhabdus sp. CUG00001]|uniref:BCCT family transporter n=1 Tax=Halorhabdus sp. CUG00001 TaxID=2600297 RepID=UPI001E517D5A|nr:BCCT family transporter [Halorhabdus sp. CUG00001]
MTDPTEETVTDGEETIRERLFYADVAREPGDTNVRHWGIEVHPVVFPLALAFIVGFVALTVGFGDGAATAYETVFDAVTANFGWFYVLSVNVFLIALVAFGLSEYGTIRLGGPDADPAFSTVAWLAMLFSAGMGIGLLFFGVAEPMYHFLSGGGSFFDVPARSPAAARSATALSMFHWGLHPWAIYGIVGLGLAFFSFNRGLPITVRSVFYPLLGERIYGWPGHIVDLAAVLATVFGLATTVGLGALQIHAGLDFLGRNYLATGLPSATWVTTAIVAVIIGLTTLSVVAGLEGGIKRLSTVNVVLMVGLLGFTLVAGPTVYLLDGFASGLGVYLGNFLALSFYAEAFAGADAGWQHDWTTFYWGFWIAWAPFVGMFIARISKGRTIRQFVGGVLLVPTLFSLLWMAVFNGSALFVELNVLSGGILGPLQEHGRAVALFELLSSYPLTFLTSVVVTANLLTFIVTSTDSGALVTSYLAAGGKQDTLARQRVLWPLLIGATAVALLVGNGLNGLQTAVIAAGLPFGAIMLLMVYTISLGLRRELDIHRSPAYRAAVEDATDQGTTAGDSSSKARGRRE